MKVTWSQNRKSYLVEMSRLTGLIKWTCLRSLTLRQIYFAVSSVMGTSSPPRSSNRPSSPSSRERTQSPRLNPEQGKPVLSQSVSFRTSIRVSKRPRHSSFHQPESFPSRSNELSSRWESSAESLFIAQPVELTLARKKRLSGIPRILWLELRGGCST